MGFACERDMVLTVHERSKTALDNTTHIDYQM